MLKAHVVNTTSQYNIDLDLAIIECYHRELSKPEEHLERQAKQHDPTSLSVLRTIPGVGRILALTILYEIGDIQRFESVQKFASYARLIKCKAESALAHRWNDRSGCGLKPRKRAPICVCCECLTAPRD